jgi:hypothetical protein
LPDIHTVALEIRYDDGFVAYLNGLKIAEANAPTSPIWNSTATASQEAGDAAYYDVSQYRNRLTAGQNLLAIQGLNQSTTSSDFLITAKLTASSQVDAGDNISPTAVVYKDPITLNETTQIKARAVNGDVWSALQDVVFVIPQLLDNVKITEIHYHPLEQDDIDDRAFEFIELKNVGQTAVDLSGAGFYQGISYKFPIGSILRAGHFIVLASDRDYFFQRYAMLPFGEYEGFLDNAGERIVLVDSAADTLLTIRYNDRDPWPVNADGDGYSLVTKDRNPFGDLNDPKNWSASHDVHGSPGANDLASTDIAPRDETMVEDYRLDQNYPNPFNAVTTIQYHLPESAQVRLMIHNVVGRTVKTYPFGRQSAGSYRIFWNGTDETDRPAASGIYFYRILIKSQRRTFTDSRKMLLLR